MLFERRWLQQAIDLIAPFIPPARLAALCDDLNSPAVNALHAMWEIAVVYAASRCSTIAYEPSLGGTSQPDLLISFQGLDMVVDITSVSNLSAEKRDPLDPFMEEFNRRVRKRGLIAEGFDFEIGSRWLREGKRTESVLAIPHPGKYQGFFTAEFDAFLNQVRLGRPAVFKCHTEETRVEITWEPGRKYIRSHYPGFGSPTSLERNSLYKRLRSKAGQLRRTGFVGLRGIVVCDAGSRVFVRPLPSSPITIARIVERFLRFYSSVDFVAVVTSRINLGASKTPDEPGPDTQLFFQPSVDQDRRATVVDLFAKIRRAIPTPNIDAHNARGWQERHGGRIGRRHMGTLFSWHREMGKEFMTASISARTLLDLLSGRMSFEEFAEKTFMFSSKHVENSSNPFRGMSSVPERLVDVRLVRSDKDDDWIEFSFEGPDPAAGPICPPADDAISFAAKKGGDQSGT